MSNKLTKTNTFDSLFGRPITTDFWGDFFTDIFNYPYDNEKGYVFSFDAPGFTENDIKIEIKDNVISISVEAKVGNSVRSINRASTLIDNMDTDKITAVLKNGILTVTVPKKSDVIEEKPEVKKIAVTKE